MSAHLRHESLTPLAEPINLQMFVERMGELADLSKLAGPIMSDPEKWADISDEMKNEVSGADQCRSDEAQEGS
jgi:hypothetical protein